MAEAGVAVVQTDCAADLVDCGAVAVLLYGEDFTAAVNGSAIVVRPVRPLLPRTTYIVALTTHLEDSTGVSIAPSTLYEMVKAQPDSGNESLDALSERIRRYEELIVDGAGLAAGDLIFSAAWTTQSSLDPLLSAVSNVTRGRVAPGVEGIGPAAVEGDGFARGGNRADVYRGTVALPYFSALPTDENPTAPLTVAWSALCDSPNVLELTDPVVVEAAPPGPNDSLCQEFGRRDLGLDLERYLTRQNPIPIARAVPDVEVLITVPSEASERADEAWPIAIVQHDLTGRKEDLLAVADHLAGAGVAMMAIDMPLHGGRGSVSTANQATRSMPRPSRSLTSSISATSSCTATISARRQRIWRACASPSTTASGLPRGHRSQRRTSIATAFT